MANIPTAFTVEVTEEHWQLAVIQADSFSSEGYTSKCAMAQAIKARFPEAYVSCGSGTVTLGNYVDDQIRNTEVWDMSAAGSAVVLAFDGRVRHPEPRPKPELPVSVTFYNRGR